MTNKEIVIHFTEEVFNKRNFSIINDYMKEDYKQHNPTVAQGREGFKQFVNGFTTKFPQVHLHIKNLYEDGDVVISHNLAVLESGKIENIVFDVYRLENGKLAEHWDCIQHLTLEQINYSDQLF